MRILISRKYDKSRECYCARRAELEKERLEKEAKEAEEYQIKQQKEREEWETKWCNEQEAIIKKVTKSSLIFNAITLISCAVIIACTRMTSFDVVETKSLIASLLYIMLHRVSTGGIFITVVLAIMSIIFRVRHYEKTDFDRRETCINCANWISLLTIMYFGFLIALTLFYLFNS